MIAFDESCDLVNLFSQELSCFPCLLRRGACFNLSINEWQKIPEFLNRNPLRSVLPVRSCCFNFFSQSR